MTDSELVKARLQSIPKDVLFHILGKTYTAEQLINEINKNSSVGKEITKQQIDYLKKLKEGGVIKNAL